MPSDFLLSNLKRARAISRAIVAGEDLDRIINTHQGEVRKTLVFLRDNPDAKRLLKRFRLPVPNRYIDTLIRASIGLGEGAKLTHNHIQQAVLSALLCPLRQAVGSCFATAPAIYIQNEQKERLLADLYDLMTVCQLRRTFGGQHYVVPISPVWGERNTDHPLLRVWEYTLASFSDYKVEFSRWNFYQSLGLDPRDPKGIGSLMYSHLQNKLEETNLEIEKRHEEYILAVEQARLAQTLLRQADSVDRMRIRKSELEVRSHHARLCNELRDEAQNRAENLASFFSHLVAQYTEKFRDYFLEIYDAQVVEINPSLYEDSPAGFSLVYKHGRTDPLAWSLIRDAQGYVTALSQFFIAVEPTLSADCEWEEGKALIQELTTMITHYLQSQDFIEFATREKTPWSYVSGGNMHKLLQCYYCVEKELTEEKCVMESPLDLLTFLLDLMKGLPYSITKRFEEDASRSLLMFSPVHAFLFKPGLAGFKAGWLDSGFTYTWIRDHVIVPGQKYYQGLQIDQEKQQLLGSQLLGESFIPYGHPLTIPEFRSYCIERAPTMEEEIDGLLFRELPHGKPLIFADTNWLHYYFAFAVNPTTLELDLYRVDPLGKSGYPMTIWKSWNDTWGVLTNPEDLNGNAFADFTLKLKKV